MGKSFNKLFATLGGIGYLPLAPGTWAAAVTAIAWYALTTNTHYSYIWQTVILLILIIAGIYCSGKIANESDKDPSHVVIDEAAGMWITLLFITPVYQNIIAGFILFRFFDIVKPLGIRKMERYGQGWGIMLDDIAAGLYGNIVLHLSGLLNLW